MAIWYVDLEGSAGAADGTSFADRSSDLAGIVNSSANGDVVRVKASLDPTSLGSLTWTEGDANISLSAGETKDIYMDGAWVGSANVTSTASTTTTVRKEGASVAQLAIAAGFTTGKIAYWALGSTQDFSAYSKISFWMRWSAAQTAATVGNYRIALCSDAVGDVIVDDLPFPADAKLANYITPITVDKGSALGSSIQSVALYVDTDPGTVTLIIDDMFATNDIALNTVISNADYPDEWYCLRSVSNNVATIDSGSTTANIALKGYPNATTTAETFISQGILLTAATAATTILYTITKTAAEGATVTVSGGWNRTDMSTQTGITHTNGKNFAGRAFWVQGNYLEFEKFMLSFVDVGLAIVGSDLTMRNIWQSACSGELFISSGTRNRLSLTDCTNCSSNGSMYMPARETVATNCKAVNISTFGYNIQGNNSVITDCIAKNNSDAGFYIANCAGTKIYNALSTKGNQGFELGLVIDCSFHGCSSIDNSAYGLYLGGGVSIYLFDFTTSGNGNVSIVDVSTAGTILQMFNFKHDEATVVGNANDYDNIRYISINDNGSPDNHIIYTEGGQISSDTTTRHTASGISWKLQPTSALRTSGYPLHQDIKGIPLKANVEHTVSVWTRRDNTGLTMQFGYVNQGVSGLSAQSVSMTGAADTWEQLSLTLTPTIDALVDFYVEAYGGTTYNGWWDDFAVAAASKNDVSSGDYGYFSNGAYVTSYSEGSSPASTETSYAFAC